MRATVEIVSKVETLHMSGETHFLVQGRLAFTDPDLPENTNEPLLLSLRLPEAVWRTVEPADVMAFDLQTEIFRPSLAEREPGSVHEMSDGSLRSSRQQ